MHLAHISFVYEKTRRWDRCHFVEEREQRSRREMKDKSLEEEVEESVVTLDAQCPLCQMSF